MRYINTVTSRVFSLDGIEHIKKFFSDVKGDKVRIYNCFENRDVLVDYVHYSDITLNGIVYASAQMLQRYLIDVIYSNNTGSGAGDDLEDAILNMGEPIVSGTTITMPALGSWRINRVVYGNPTAFVLNTSLASAGKYRTDLITATTDSVNKYKLYLGIESDTQTLPPATPNGELAVSVVNVFGSSISPPVVDDGAFVKKERYFNSVTQINANGFITLTKNGGYAYSSGASAINGFEIPAGQNSLNLDFVGGRIITLSNESLSNRTLTHNSGVADKIKLIFPSGQNYTHRPREVLQFRATNQDELTMISSNYTGVSLREFLFLNPDFSVVGDAGRNFKSKGNTASFQFNSSHSITDHNLLGSAVTLPAFKVPYKCIITTFLSRVNLNMLDVSIYAGLNSDSTSKTEVFYASAVATQHNETIIKSLVIPANSYLFIFVNGNNSVSTNFGVLNFKFEEVL